MSDSQRFIPHTTVATVVTANIDGVEKFLMVEEKQAGITVFNQPAGHLEANESLVEAAVRETLEETGYAVSVSGFLGLSLYTAPSNGVTYHRVTFLASVNELTDRALDPAIIQAHWLSFEEITQQQTSLRSPLVLDAIERYLSGNIYPLTLIRHFA